jgi:hypothetical protein
MVDQQEVIRLWKQQPFQPFRLYMNNGDVYVVRHPELFTVFPTYVRIGIPVPNHPLLLCERVERPLLSDMVRLEVLPSLATQTSER